MNSIAIAGIHTGIGKTIVSAVLAEIINADYWKPVQAGAEERDALVVKKLLTDGETRVHDEAVLLSQPLSPHAAAAHDGVVINYEEFAWPQTEKLLLVETAGGLLSPMTATKTMADFISHYQLPVILVSQNYLGSINHTLMTIEVLKNRGIHLTGLIINGVENATSESFIEKYGKHPIIARIPQLEKLDNHTIKEVADQVRQSIFKAFTS
jgi:dethiobiotin synthetase